MKTRAKFSYSFSEKGKKSYEKVQDKPRKTPEQRWNAISERSPMRKPIQKIQKTPVEIPGKSYAS